MPGTETFHDILARRAAGASRPRGPRGPRPPRHVSRVAARVDRTAAALQNLGLGRRRRHHPAAELGRVRVRLLACERIGAIANQIGPDFRSREWSTSLRFSESRAFVCPATFRGSDYVEMVRQLRPGSPGSRRCSCWAAATPRASRSTS